MMQIWMSMLTWNAVILERYASTSSLHKAKRRRAYMRLVPNPQTPMQVASRGCAVFIGNAAVQAFFWRDVLGYARC